MIIPEVGTNLMILLILVIAMISILGIVAVVTRGKFGIRWDSPLARTDINIDGSSASEPQPPKTKGTD